jgi:hypothetical protein
VTQYYESQKVPNPYKDQMTWLESITLNLRCIIGFGGIANIPEQTFGNKRTKYTKSECSWACNFEVYVCPSSKTSDIYDHPALDVDHPKRTPAPSLQIFAYAV